jgi:hypothetical protein
MRVKNTGYILINKIKNVFGDTIITDMEPKFLGKYLVTVISPVTNRGVNNNKDAKKESSEIDNK